MKRTVNDRFAVRGKRTVATALMVPPLLVAGLMMFPTTVAVTSAEPNDMASLITQLADTNQQIEQLTADVQTQQESINKGLVDLQAARDNAASAAAQVAEGQRAVDAANGAIEEAQGKFDRMAAATYMAGPSTSYLTATNPDDVVRLASVTKSVEASRRRSWTICAGRVPSRSTSNRRPGPSRRRPTRRPRMPNSNKTIWCPR